MHVITYIKHQHLLAYRCQHITCGQNQIILVAGNLFLVNTSHFPPCRCHLFSNDKRRYKRREAQCYQTVTERQVINTSVQPSSSMMSFPVIRAPDVSLLLEIPYKLLMFSGEIVWYRTALQSLLPTILGQKFAALWSWVHDQHISVSWCKTQQTSLYHGVLLKLRRPSELCAQCAEQGFIR